MLLSQFSREQEAALIQGAYSQISNLTLELEHERQKVKELENQVALGNEELETVVTQLDETGRQLDDTNNEVSIYFIFLKLFVFILVAS